MLAPSCPVIALRPHEVKANHVAPCRITWRKVRWIDVAERGFQYDVETEHSGALPNDEATAVEPEKVIAQDSGMGQAMTSRRENELLSSQILDSEVNGLANGWSVSNSGGVSENVRLCAKNSGAKEGPASSVE